MLIQLTLYFQQDKKDILDCIAAVIDINTLDSQGKMSCFITITSVRLRP